MNEEKLIELTRQLEKINNEYQLFIDNELSEVENNDYQVDNNYLWNIQARLTKIEFLINEICKYVVTHSY